MNLNNIAAPLVSAINPRELITIQSAIGYITNPDGTRTPATPTTTQVLAQVQNAVYDDIQMNGGINLSGEQLNIYLPGNWSGVIRADQKDGDVIIRADGTRYLVIAVPENWQNSNGWVKVLATRQV